MSSRAKSPHPHLADFLGAWFHQDFDLVGETIEEVVDAYARTADIAARHALAADVESFLGEGDARDLDVRFMRDFDPDIDPTGLAVDTRDFLERILRRLEGLPQD
jgi:CdiI immunity protein